MTERDLSVFFIPLRHLWVDSIKSGELPLWNPYSYSGHPLLATLQPGVFYPPNILLLTLPFDLAFNWIIILHFLLAGVFILILVRGLGVSMIGALISALTFMLGGYLISVHNLLSTLLSVTWVPLVIFLYLKALKNDSTSYALLTGIILAVMFTGGGIEVVYGTVGLLIFFTLLPDSILSLSSSCQCNVRLTRRTNYLFLSLIIFLSLSAIQLIPFLELSHYSIRVGGFSYHEATVWSMDLKDIIQFFIPDPYGYGTSEAKYWSNQSWLKTIYLGTIPFILSIFFFLERGRRTLPFIFILLFSFALAFGKNTVIYEYLYYYLPSFNKIRYPVKFLFLVFILLSVSTGSGWDSLKQNLEQGRKSGKWIILSLLFFAALAAIAFGWLSYFDKEAKDFLIEKGIKYPEYNAVYINLFNAKRLIVIFIMTALILYGGLRSMRARKILPYLLVSLLTIDLFFAHIGYYYKTKREDYHRSSESMDFILNDKNELFRVFVTPKTKRGEVVVSATENDKKNTPSSTAGIEKELIQGYNIERRIFDVEGFEVMRLSDYEKVFLILITAPGPGATNLLALLNVKYVLSIPKIESKEFKLVKIIRPETGKDWKELEKENFLKIYQNLNYLPRAFLVENYRVLTKREDFSNAVQELQNKTFHPVKEVLLYEKPWGKDSSESRQEGYGRGQVLKKTPSPLGGEGRGEGEVVIQDYRLNAIKLRVNIDRPKILVLSETYYPGWKVFVDGKERKILKANLAFRGVALKPGEHKVEFIYDPWTFKVGLYITVAAIVLLTGSGLFRVFRGRKNKVCQTCQSLQIESPPLAGGDRGEG